MLGKTETFNNVRVEEIDRGPVENNWGTPAIDAMIPIAAEFVRRDSSMSFAIDRRERAPLIIDMSEWDVQKAQQVYDYYASIETDQGILRAPVDRDDVEALQKVLAKMIAGQSVLVAMEFYQGYQISEG